MLKIDSTGVDFPHIDGEIDDIKALEFAHQLCTLATKTSPDLADDAERTAASLKVLIDTAKGFEKSQVDRFEFLETMLRKDGMAVVIYLEASNVRARLKALGFPDIADQVSDEEIGERLQATLSTQVNKPAPLYDWAGGLEDLAANELAAISMKAAGGVQ